jgi:hypothetical protein
VVSDSAADVGDTSADAGDGGPLPATCADIVAASATPPPDGTYTLYVGANAAKPWTAYCRNMSTTPLEYLTLPTPANNVSQFTTGGAASGTNVVTTYSRVRLQVDVLAIDGRDETYATTTGSLAQEGNCSVPSVASMAYGSAMSCDSTASGTASIDLTGTPFAVMTGQFDGGGYEPVGSATYSQSNQVVRITGGGDCGWFGPGAAPVDPANGGTYTGPSDAGDCIFTSPILVSLQYQ